MFVHRWMTTQVVSIASTALTSEGLYRMENHHIKRLPVVDEARLVGIVHRNDLIRILFLQKEDPPLGEVMVKEVITISADAALEEAALLMEEHHIASLPVVDDLRLAGIITESDLFKAFVQVMGLLEGGQRVTLRVKDRPGALIQALEPIRSHEVNIISVTSCKVPGGPRGTKEVTLRLQTRELSMLVSDLLKHRVDVVDWR